MSEVAGTAPDLLARVPAVLWRLADDRVILLRVDGSASRLTAELTGPTAVVWLALDRPRSFADVVDELTAAGSDDPGRRTSDAVAELVAAGLVNWQPPGGL